MIFQRKNELRATDTIDFRPRVSTFIMVLVHHLHFKIELLQTISIHHLLLLQMKVQ